MLQRIQSVFLLLALVLNLTTLFVPLWQYEMSGDTYQISGLSVSQTPSELTQANISFFAHEQRPKAITHTSLFVLVLGASLFLGLIIFGYRNRIRQIRWSYLAIVLILFEILALVLLTTQSSQLGSTPAWGFALPVLSVLLTWLAIRQIRKDDDLVKSVDRIR